MKTSWPAFMPGLADRFEHDLDRLAVRLQVRREAALVADAGRLAALLQDAAQRVEDLGARRAAPRRTTAAPTGMTMNSWKSTLVSACAPPLRMFIIGTGSVNALVAVERADVPVERHVPRRARRRAQRRHRDAEQRVGAEPALGRRAVERDHRLVERALVEVAADERLRDLAVDVARPPCARPCRRSAPCRRRAARAPRARRSTRPTAPPRGPRAPPSSVTSTSTVGLPRESRISRPCTRVIFTTSSARAATA